MTVIDPYRTGPPPPPAPPPPVLAARGAYRVDNAAAWAMSLVPIAVWLIRFPLGFTFNFTALAYVVSLVLTIWGSYIAFYIMDRSALRQAGIDARAWDAFWMLGPLAYLIQRSRYTGQPWAMPVTWVAGLFVALVL